MIRKVVQNTFFLSASQMGARAIGFFYLIFLARSLGVETFGIYTFTLAFVYGFVPVADFGLERLVLRDISREPGKAPFYFQRLLPLRFLLTIGAYLGLLALGILLKQTSRQIFYFAIFGFYLIPYSLTYLLVSFQNAREKMGYMAVANITIPILTAIFGVPVVFLRLPLGFLFLAIVLANLLIALIFFSRASLWNLRLTWWWDKKFWQKALSQSWPFALLLIFSVFYLRTSLILVGILKGAFFTGLYGSAFKFIEALILVPQSLALALFPLSSRLFAEDKEKLAGIYQKGLAVLLLLSLPFAFVMLFLPQLIINLAYGKDYLAAVPVFSVLGFAVVLFFLNSLPANIILNSPKVRQFLPLAALNLAIKVVLCLILISRFSIVGAAWAVVGGEIAGLLINNWFVWRIFRN